jgi:phage-related minor tail protein
MSTVGELVAKISLGGMDAVEKQLKKFSSSMKKISQEASQMGEKLRQAGESFNEIGENIAPLSAGLIAVGSAGVIASDNINSAINNFQTKLGATGADLARYEQVMKDVASTGVGSFEEVSDAVILVGKSMKGLSNKELATVTEEAMQLASVMGTDISEVSKVAGQMMKQFGISGTEALDLIAKGYQKGMDYAGDYMDTINEYSVYFKSLGFNANDMFNILAEGASKGAFNLDKVGDAVKEFNIRAKDGSKTTAEAFKALGFDANKMSETFAKGGDGAKKAFAQVVQALAKVDDQTERNQLGVALFGTQYEDMEKDVIASMGKIQNHMKGFEGTASEVAKNNRNFAQEMQGAWNKIQIAIKPIGDAIRGAILDVMPYVVSAVQGVSKAFGSLSPTMQKVVLAFGAFIAFLPALIIGLGSMATLAGTFMSGISVLAKGFGLLSGGALRLIGVFKNIIQWVGILARVFMANPFMLIIAGLIVVAVLIYKNWDKIKAYIKAGASALWSYIQSGLSKVRAFFSSVFSAIHTSIIKPVISKIKSLITTLISSIQAVVNKVRAVFQSAWSAIYSSVVSPVVSRIKSIVQTLSSTASSVSSKVKSAFSSAWNGIKSFVGNAINSIKSKISSIWSTASSIASKVKSAFSNIFKGIKVPRFSLGGWTVKDLPKLPKISISWHAKGGILDSATLIGAGEKGAEAIVPLSSQRRMRPFAQAVARFMPESKRATGKTVIHVAQLVVREEADIDRIAQRLNQLQERKERARGGLSFNG